MLVFGVGVLGFRGQGVGFTTRKVHIRLPGKGNSDSHGARPIYQNHLDDSGDSDQEVVDQKLPLSLWGLPGRQRSRSSCSETRVSSRPLLWRLGNGVLGLWTGFRDRVHGWVLGFDLGFGIRVKGVGIEGLGFRV